MTAKRQNKLPPPLLLQGGKSAASPGIVTSHPLPRPIKACFNLSLITPSSFFCRFENQTDTHWQFQDRFSRTLFLSCLVAVAVHTILSVAQQPKAGLFLDPGSHQKTRSAGTEIRRSSQDKKLTNSRVRPPIMTRRILLQTR